MKLQFEPYVFEPYIVEPFNDFYVFPSRKDKLLEDMRTDYNQELRNVQLSLQMDIRDRMEYYQQQLADIQRLYVKRMRE